jgi:hypothetical protein
LILFAAGIFGLALADLVRWSPERASASRAWLSIVCGVGGTGALLALAAGGAGLVVGFACGEAVVLGLWVGLDYVGPRYGPKLQLAVMAVVVGVLFGLSGSVGPVEGPLGRWYENLGFGFVEMVPVDQFIIGVAAGLFLTASSNRLVRLILEAAAIRLKSGEKTLAGGRVLGPLERLIVAAIVIAGDPAAAAIVVTGKGLLRFPEIRSERTQRGPDFVTEYFLIGTFTSLLLAGFFGLLVLAAG